MIYPNPSVWVSSAETILHKAQTIDNAIVIFTAILREIVIPVLEKNHGPAVLIALVLREV